MFLGLKLELPALSKGDLTAAKTCDAFNLLFIEKISRLFVFALLKNVAEIFFDSKNFLD